MLTLAQQTALDELFMAMPEGSTRGTAVILPSALTDLLQTWLGLSGEQMQGHIETLLHQRTVWEGRFLDWMESNPMESAYSFLGTAAIAFYAVEKDENPKVNTYIDAFHYIATCASVGYADIFAVTQAGKAIAALVMVIGPGLADRALNRPA